MNIKASKSKSKPTQEKRPPKKITSVYLHNSGLYYLQRFATSSSNFRKVMLRKAYKSCKHHEDQTIEDCKILIDELITKFEASGLLNDEIYTRAMVTTLRRQGKSSRAITMKLKNKGLSEEVIKQNLDEYDAQSHEDPQDAEHQAALTFARKKRLGPFDKSEETDHKKALAKMARAGFSFDTARNVLNLGSEEAEELI